MGLTPEQERKKADALAYIELMRKSDELLKDTGSVSWGYAEQILNQLNYHKDKYGHALTTGRLDTAISEWSAIVQDKKEQYELYGDIRNAYNNKIASIDANLKRNEDIIAGQRESAIKNAYANYDRSKSTYGQNAEKLARMGLGNGGYSDYLTGVAYGNMVGGIESANTSANEALEAAYYNADQQKLAAASERDTAIAEAKKAYADKEASLIMAINKGEIDTESAKTLAKIYGLTSGTIANLEKIGLAYKENAETLTYDEYKAQITPDTTYADIDAFKLDEVTTEKLKKYRDDEIVKNTIASLEAQGAKMGDIENIDDMYDNKDLSDDAYHQIYFNHAMRWIEGVDKADEVEEGIAELDRLKYWEKISEADYESLKKYLYRKAITEVDQRRLSVNIGENTATVELGGNTYNVSLKDANADVKKFLENVEVSDKGIIEYNNALYMYVDGQWKVLGDDTTTTPSYNYDQRGYYSTSTSTFSGITGLKQAFALEANSGYSSKTTKPTHQQ